MENNKISLLDLILVLLEKKRFLIISMFLVSIGAVTWTMVMKKYYQSSAILLPSKSSSSLSNPISALMNDMPMNNIMKSFDFLDGGSDNDQVLTILESRRIAELVIEKFNLAKRYKFTRKKKYFYEDVLTAFFRNYEFIETDLKNISISFTDTCPEFTAEVVNFIVTQLDSINSELSRDNARNTRVFFESRLKIVEHDLDSAHTVLAEFQEKNNFLDLEQQVLSSIEALSLVEAQIMSNDINTEMLKNRYGASNYEVTELQKTRRVLEARMKHYLQEGSGELIIPLKNAPRLGIEYSYLLRNVKVQELLYAFLLHNYEQAKLTEARNTPTVTVLEYPKIPQKKIRPKRMIMCLLIFTIGFIVVSFIIFVGKWYEIHRKQQTVVYHKLQRLFTYIRKW